MGQNREEQLAKDLIRHMDRGSNHVHAKKDIIALTLMKETRVSKLGNTI